MSYQVYQGIEAQVPGLRRYAIALAPNRIAADDLLQQSVERALLKAHAFRPETDLRAWLLTVMHNVHVSNVRACNDIGVPVDPGLARSTLATPPMQASTVVLRALGKAMTLMPDEQRLAAAMATIQGISFGEIARHPSMPPGSVESRRARGKRNARAALHGTIKPYSRAPAHIPRGAARQDGAAAGTYRSQ